MKTILLFFLIISFQNIFAFKGEFLIKLQNVQNESWWLYVYKIEGENYYDRNHQLVSPETILEFSFQGPDNIKYPENVIKADFTGSLYQASKDYHNNDFVFYYGKYKIVYDDGIPAHYKIFFIDYCIGSAENGIWC